MADIKKGIFLINTLSLDVAAGATLSAAFVFRLLHLKPELAFWIVLPLSVWVVYTSDHLVDAMRLKENAHTIRHRFHYRHFKTLAFVAGLLAIIDITVALTSLPVSIIEFGLATGLAILAYLLLLHFFGGKSTQVLQKELIVALVYVAGVWGGPLALTDFHLTESQWVLLIIFLLLAFADVLLFTIFDAGTDEIDHHQTLSARYGHKLPLYFFYSIVALVCLASLFFLLTHPDHLMKIAGYLYLAMAVFLFFIVFFRNFFKRKKSYRYLGEIVFWIPGLILFF